MEPLESILLAYLAKLPTSTTRAVSASPGRDPQCAPIAVALPRLEQHRRRRPKLCQPAATGAASSWRAHTMKSPDW